MQKKLSLSSGKFFRIEAFCQLFVRGETSTECREVMKTNKIKILGFLFELNFLLPFSIGRTFSEIHYKVDLTNNGQSRRQEEKSFENASRRKENIEQRHF